MVTNLISLENITLLRKHLGLTQANIALYLGISVSLIKMVEAGKRELPNASALKLSILEGLVFGRQEGFLSTIKTKKGSKEQQLLRRSIRQLEMQVSKSDKLLQQMEQRYSQALNRLACLPHLFKKLSQGDEGQTDKLWLEILEAEAYINLEKYGPEAQAVTKWKRDTYQYSMIKAKEVLASL